MLIGTKFQSPFGDSMGITGRENETRCLTFSIPFGGFPGDIGGYVKLDRLGHVSIPFRGFHGDNLEVSRTSFIWCFNPLSGIPWG